jgi:hypothetical protein
LATFTGPTFIACRTAAEIAHDAADMLADPLVKNWSPRQRL